MPSNSGVFYYLFINYSANPQLDARLLVPVMVSACLKTASTAALAQTVGLELTVLSL